MPLTLKQLKAQRDNHVKKIEDYQRIAKDCSAQVVILRIDPESFFSSIFHPSSQFTNIITAYPYLKQILECMYKAAKEEKKRRECEQKIVIMQDIRLKKRKREDDEDEEEERRRSLRIKMIEDGSGEGTSQINEMDTI